MATAGTITVASPTRRSAPALRDVLLIAGGNGRTCEGAQGIEAPGGLDYLMMAGGFLLFGVVLAMFANWLARDDERFLIDFVARTTQAEVVDRGPA